MPDLFNKKISFKKRYCLEREIALHIKQGSLSLLLDSSLISQSRGKRVTDIKLVNCGKYKHVYYYKKPRVKRDDKIEKLKDNDKICVAPFSSKKKKSREPPPLKTIELKNILRSRFELQRLVKCNEDEFKTFITLTFADNVTDVEYANKKFNIWRRNLKRSKSDFKYICVPEFQKRGAIHYHLLTNIDYTDFKILNQEEKRIYNKKSGWQVGRSVKGWIYGYSMTKDLKDINVVGYISKYMTKDIDNRLWGKRRYLYSQNLVKPETLEFDLRNLEDFKHLVDLTNDCDITYEHDYIDFLNNEVLFCEMKKKET